MLRNGHEESLCLGRRAHRGLPSSIATWYIAWLQGLDSSRPRLKLPDGSWVEGRYEETIGTCMVFTDDSQASSVAGGSGPVRYLCKTEQRLCFTK